MKTTGTLKIKHIAEIAGVSVATVSRVINQNGRFSPETETRVRKVIKEIGYVPDSMARGLRTSKTNVIGIIVPDILNPHFAGLVLELEKNLFAQSYSSVICNTNESADLEKKHIDTLIAQHVSGIIFISGSDACTATGSIPVLYLDRRPMEYDEGSGLVIIESDNHTGGYVATNKLIATGSKNIAIVCSKTMDYNQKARYSGFRQAMDEAGLAIGGDRIFVLDEVSVHAARTKILDAFPRSIGIDGILCMTDTIALGVMTALHELRIAIPSDVSVIGYDDAPLAEFFQPPLTTVRQDVVQMAHTAARFILNMINGELPGSRHTIIPVTLITRRSTR